MVVKTANNPQQLKTSIATIIDKLNKKIKGAGRFTKKATNNTSESNNQHNKNRTCKPKAVSD